MSTRPLYLSLYPHFGIKSKLILLFLLSSILPLLLVGYYGYRSSVESLIENQLITDQQNIENLTNTFQSIFENNPNDLFFLINLQSLEQFLQWQTVGEPYKTEQWLENTRDTFHAFLAAKKDYSHLQLLNKHGQEIIHVKYNSLRDKTTLVPLQQLQNQEHQDYFSKTITLGKGELYFSGLIIDREEEYERKIIQYATPLIDRNALLQGVLVLTFQADRLLNILKTANQNTESNNNSTRYFLIKEDGTYLYHPFLKQQTSFQFPELLQKSHFHSQGIFMQENTLFSYSAFSPLMGTSYQWILIKQTDQNNGLLKIQQLRVTFSLTVLGILIVILIIAGWLTKTLINPLLSINHHLKALSQGKILEENVDYQKPDEIGELVISLWRVKNGIKNTIGQANSIAAGNYDTEVQLLSQQDQLGRALSDMTHKLRKMTLDNNKQGWLKTGQTQLHDQIRGEQTLTTLSQNIIHFLANWLDAQIGVIYLVENNVEHIQVLKLTASYAYTKRKNFTQTIFFGEGLVGQAALEQQIIVINQIPDDYIPIQSGLGIAQPRHLLIMPFSHENALKGVIELGSFQTFTDTQITFLNLISTDIAIAIYSAQSRLQLQTLLQQTQTQTEELQSQAEELQSQQEELRQTNEELEERTKELERQKEEIHQKNQVLEKSQATIELKAQELAKASQYKSEFLANMSHELRTPLNSLLILAQLLADNKDRNLTEKQVEYARTICSAGSDLLTLINEILDLSKVEAGKVEVQIETLLLQDLLYSLQQKFQPIAQEKKFDFIIRLAENLPGSLQTDAQRLKQILNNLLSNAFKFTQQGRVELYIHFAELAEFPTVSDSTVQSKLHNLQDLILSKKKVLAWTVTDTGIGIPKDKQHVIFEAFQQVDGTTSRRYGGTGLGLSISRQLARLLGGEITLESVEGQGSIFTCYLPLTVSEESQWINSVPAQIQLPVAKEIKAVTDRIADDREHIGPQDKFILIIEDDRKFSRILIELAHEKGFKCLLAEEGKLGLQLAEYYQPHAIILDVGLPKVDGWTVMEKLKENAKTRHIPVHFMSASDQGANARRMGAIGYLLKPVSMAELTEAFKKIEQFVAKMVKNLLVLVDQEPRQQDILNLIGNEDIQYTVVSSKSQALNCLQNGEYDCFILDADVEQGTGIEMLETFSAEDCYGQIPTIIYSERELSVDEENILQQCAQNLTVKTVRTPERLLDEATLFLHQLSSKLPKEKRKMLQMVHDKAAILANKKVLVVDDDMRNTFALATVLEDNNMEVVVGKTGKEALVLLEKHPDVALVLMDIMMPEMDGYEAIQKIREQSQFRKLPIIALTAKAMKGDKAKCIEAGANDYLSKPVDTDKLLSLMRVWLYR